MFVLVSARGASAEAVVREQLDFSRLHVELHGVADAAAGQALQEAGLGVLDEEHAWLEVNALRAAGGATPQWNENFDAMLRYADSKGWADEARGRVRAHIVRT